MRRRKQQLQDQLDAIQARAVADSRKVEDDTGAGYEWQKVYPGQVLGRSLTCQMCGAVVTLQTQDIHTAWHAATP